MESLTANAWEQIALQLNLRRGHFELESGHHGDLWFDLELLFRDPEAVRPLCDALAERIARFEPEIICGPMVEGSFVALQIATKLGLEFVYTERRVISGATGLFPVRYEIPGKLRDVVSGRRVAIVNDVVNAGSALRGTLIDLADCAAVPVALGTLLVLGEDAGKLADEAGLPLESLTTQRNTVYTPDECPMCRAGTTLVPHHGS